MSRTVTQVSERRRETRRMPRHRVRVHRALPVVPLSDAQVLNVSDSGVALRTGVPLRKGDRLSFSIGDELPRILAEVLAVEPLDGQAFRVRCRCLLGGFEEA